MPTGRREHRRWFEYSVVTEYMCVQIWVVNLKLITTQIGKTFVLSLPCPRPEVSH